MKAIVLAGGRGTRLRPFTNTIPKPLVPVGDMPILEILLRQLVAAGITDVVIAVNHLARLIQAFFGDGRELGMSIRYALEDEPLGTAGPLREIGVDEDVLVMNGDLLTTLDFSDLVRWHITNGHDLTIGTFMKDVPIDLGVLRMGQDQRLIEYVEKPTYHFAVSMGIYCLNPTAAQLIPANGPFDMPDLVRACLSHQLHVGSYRGEYEWLDIGRAEDYQTAVDAFTANRSRYLPDRENHG